MIRPEDIPANTDRPDNANVGENNYIFYFSQINTQVQSEEPGASNGLGRQKPNRAEISGYSGNCRPGPHRPIASFWMKL